MVNFLESPLQVASHLLILPAELELIILSEIASASQSNASFMQTEKQVSSRNSRSIGMEGILLVFHIAANAILCHPLIQPLVNCTNNVKSSKLS